MLNEQKKTDVAALRRNYALRSLDEQEALADPFQQFDRWFEEAIRADLREANAFTLATVNSEGRPSARIVLLKGFDANGFVFYTNYESRKGMEMAENPYVSLLFHWMELERQVRIEGRVEKVSTEESLEYFQSRPRGSQLGAWASDQSAVIISRTILEEKMEALLSKYPEPVAVPLPPFWGGYRVIPDRFEFWQGRESRLHDRLVYQYAPNHWRLSRLSP